MLKARMYLFFVFAAAFTPSLISQAKPKQGPPVDSLQKEVSDLQTEIKWLKARLTLDETLLGQKQSKVDDIPLDLTEKAFQRLDSQSGFFLVSVEDASPYLSGYKIHLAIGNPLSAAYRNYKLKVKWSKPYDWSKYTSDSYDEWSKGIQEKEISFPDALESGKWNKVDVVLSPVTAEQLGYLRLSIETDSVFLRTE